MVLVSIKFMHKMYLYSSKQPAYGTKRERATPAIDKIPNKNIPVNNPAKNLLFIPPPLWFNAKKWFRILISLLIYAKTTPEMSAFLYLNNNKKLD